MTTLTHGFSEFGVLSSESFLSMDICLKNSKAIRNILPTLNKLPPKEPSSEVRGFVLAFSLARIYY